jgi:2-keto-4-pentenoate hydratase/2-oxohepta-3-ene-1,7-dioic acid hydratase in catechol pathway
MRLLRFQDGEHSSYGKELGDGTAIRCVGDPFEGLHDTSDQIDLACVGLLPPVIPSKIVCLGLNYRDHATEHETVLPDEPLLFHKPPSALIAAGDSIELVTPGNHNDEEAELVIVIGRRARRISPDAAAQHILGYTIGNDVTDRDIQKADRTWMARAKGYDTYAPVGPVIDTEIDPRDLAICARINGHTVQAGSTRNLVFPVDELVSFVSHVSTLHPGDLIFTGTPSGVSRIMPGDQVEIEIESIGCLTNAVIEAQSH